MKQQKTKAVKPSPPGKAAKGPLREPRAFKNGTESREMLHDLSARGSGDPEEQREASARGAGSPADHDIPSKRGEGGWDGFAR